MSDSSEVYAWGVSPGASASGEGDYRDDQRYE